MGIYNLGGGGGAPELQAKEATPLITNAQQIILPDEGYDGLSKVTVNPMPTGVLKTPTVNSIGYVSSGVQTAGYFDTSATSGLQLNTQNGGYVVPSTTNTVAILKGQYALDTIYAKGDANLIPTNIVAGKSIFGVIGNASVARGLDLIRYTKVSNSQARFTLNPEQSTLPSLVYGFALKATSVETGQSNYIYKFSLAGQYNFEQQRQQYFQYTPISLKDNASTDCVVLTITLTMEDSKNITVDIAGAAGIFGYSTYAASIYGGGYL